jgi:DNA-directed RNA polymerase specialized sigma24 family protein
MHATELDPETFYNRHLPSLVELALSSHVSLEEAEDLAHEVLFSSFRNLSKIANVDAWLAGSIRSAIASRNGA